MLSFGDGVFEELVHGPADGRGGHLVDHSGLDAFKESRRSPRSVNRPKRFPEARDVPSSHRARRALEDVHGLGFLGVEQRFAHVEGSGDGGG